ncbi:MAG: hypothetical protein QM490_05265 [Candidatus Gracilibacteria bacterium]
MKDIIKKYQNHKLLSNLNIILASLVLAFGINFLLIDGNEIGKYLKISALDTQIIENKSDLFIEKIENDFFIISNNNINQITNLSLSLAYNPENVSIIEVSSNIGDIINLTNTKGISSLILTTEKALDIKAGDKLIKLNIEKKEEKPENINILNANFKDINEEQFLFSTSGVTF